ncbi:MAG: hypothetical protein LBQ22_13155 [Bacteroidales bacterium]|jgi:hypothetical protein|nr:hypothetical protein [Bacteroidales bacterium]
MNKEILNNKWVKVGIVTIGVASVIGVIVYVIKKKNDKKKLANLISSAQKEIGVNPTATNNNVTVQNNGIGLVSSYTANSFTANKKTYIFEKSGIIKLQKYFSEKDPEAKKLIAESGGFDGIIGKAFVTSLSILSKKMPLSITFTDTYIKSLFTLAKLNTNEFEIRNEE